MKKFLLLIPLTLGFCSCVDHHYHVHRKSSSTIYRTPQTRSESPVSVSASQDNGSYVEGVR